MGRKILTDKEKFIQWMQKIEIKNDCWLWTGKTDECGYVYSHHIYLHKWFYEFFNKKISSGMVLHHLCKNKNCLNPSHMKLMTNQEHSKNHSSITTGKGFFKCGHESKPENIGCLTVRFCRICKRKRDSNYRKEKRRNHRIKTLVNNN